MATGRPAKYPEWAAKMWDALWSVHPKGLTPSELTAMTGLSQRQVQRAARYMRDTFPDEPNPPVMFVRKTSDEVEGNTWYIVPSWADHTRSGLRSEYLQQCAARMLSAEKLLKQADRAFPQHARRIRKVLRNTAYTREEIEDLLTVL